MSETPTLWLVVGRQEYEGWNGREWGDEDADVVAERGYFLSKEDAQGYIDTEKKRLVEEGSRKDAEELVRNNTQREQRYLAAVEEDKVKRREYDALVEAGITPSFKRPAERPPFKPVVSKFNAEVYLRGLGRDWEIVEIGPYQEGT